jgi:hypothetical protein
LSTDLPSNSSACRDQSTAGVEGGIPERPQEEDLAANEGHTNKTTPFSLHGILRFYCSNWCISVHNTYRNEQEFIQKKDSREEVAILLKCKTNECSTILGKARK